MLKATWTGTINFGLVNVPVKLFGATEEHGVQLHRTHEACTAPDSRRLSQQMVCKDCAQVVPYGEQGSVYVDSDGTTVALSKDDLAGLPGTKTKSIDLLEFVDASEIDPIRWGKTYYLRPDRKALKGLPTYELLVSALEKASKVALGRIVMRSRESLVAVMPSDGGLVARVILWADEVRAPEFNEPEQELAELPTEHVLKAVELIESMSIGFDITRHVDARDAALSELISSRLPQPEPADTLATVHELFATIERAMDVG